MRKLIFGLLFLAAPAFAQPVEIPREIAGEDWNTPAHLIASVEQAIPLVRRTKEIPVADYSGTLPSDLRVSLLILHNGPSTDVSPRQDLHLAMFNAVAEYGTAWAIVPVASIWEFYGATRQAAGIYDIEADVIGDFGVEDCYFYRVTIRVDARELSAMVRSAPGLHEFEARRYRHPIGISVNPLRCAKPQ